MSAIVLLFVALVGLSGSSIIQTPQKYDWDKLLANGDFPETKDYENFVKTLPKAVAEDGKLQFVPLATKYGYPAEEHYVQTSDGYILNFHRIPYGKAGPPKKSKGVVYMQHGLLSSSIDWLIAGPDYGFGYILADKGYDVWFGNSRGNRYCKNHTDKIGSNEFWNFSWHEIATIDVPTMIDYILEKTNQKQLIYIGFSQGTTIFYVMCSELPEYNSKIRGQFSLAPIAYMEHMTSPLLKFIAFFDGSISALLNLIGVHEFLPTNGLLHEISKTFCREGILQPLCSNTLFLMCGFNKDQLNMTLLPVVMEQLPAGGSTKQMLHYGQLINSGSLLVKGKFRQYDYGTKENKKIYKQRNPPDYDLSKITAPVYLFYSENDWLSHPKDVRRLRDELGNCVHAFLVPHDKFNHLDYMYGIDANNLVYDKVLSLMVRLPKA